MKWAIGTAILTKAGIEFNGNCYSCKEAIRDQWFANVQQTGSIEMEIYCEADSDQIVFLEFGSTWIACLKVDGPQDVTDAHARYYSELQNLRARKFFHAIFDGKEEGS
jgi:hypothetical protein